MQKNNTRFTPDMRLAATSAPLWRYGLAVICALLLAGCSRENQPTKPVADNGSGLTILNEGYSMLYQDLSGLSAINKLLYVKLETDAVDKVISAIAKTASDHVKALDAMKASNPGLQFDLDPLPVMEKRKRAAAQSDRTWGLAPVIGRTGADFERTLLLTLSGAMNQLRYLEGELAKAEVSDARRAQLKKLKPDLDRRYTDIVDLLNLEYFVDFSTRLTSEQAQAQLDGKLSDQEGSDKQAEKTADSGGGENGAAAKPDQAAFGQSDPPQITPAPNADGAATTSNSGKTTQPAADQEKTQYFGPRSR